MVHDLQFFHKDILNRFHILERQRGNIAFSAILTPSFT